MCTYVNVCMCVFVRKCKFMRCMPCIISRCFGNYNMSTQVYDISEENNFLDLALPLIMNLTVLGVDCASIRCHKSRI